MQYYVEHMDEWTWDVMLDLCGQLQKGMANEQTKPRIVEAMWRWLILFYGLVRAEDGVYLDASGSAVLDEGFQNALNLVRDLIDKGYTTFDTNLTELNRFHSAQSVIAFQSRPYLATAVVLEDDLEILPFPRSETTRRSAREPLATASAPRRRIPTSHGSLSAT